MTAAFDRLLHDFPTVQAAFGYGSGIFRQHGAAAAGRPSQAMLDFIFAVRDPLEWHEQVNQSGLWTSTSTYEFCVISLFYSRQTI